MITPIKIFSPVFKQRYVNPDNTSVDVNEIAINQAKRQMQIRKSVEEGIKQSDNDSFKHGDVYFTLFSDGSCKLTKNKVLPIWHGIARNVNPNKQGWISSEINSMSVSYGFLESSDKEGNVRANGNGKEFATIYPNGDIFIKKSAEEIFQEK